MITHLEVKNFNAVPYLETTKLMQLHGSKLEFSTVKPNVIVGPNGSGKSALVDALSMLTLTYFEDTSTYDPHYINSTDSDKFWSKERASWRDDHRFLAGLDAETDLAPALYYRPNRIPGNEKSIAHAMMTGYFTEAKAYGMLTDSKSSGERSKAIQQLLHAVLEGNRTIEYTHNRWGDPDKLTKIDPRYYSGDLDFKRNAFINYYKNRKHDGMPLVLLDEPEQALDTLAEVRLWQSIAGMDCTRNQLICASHSIYPFLHPEKFNIIEAVPDYVANVQHSLKYMCYNSDSI